MLNALLRRLALSVLVLWLVSVLVFVSTEILPGDALQVSLTNDEASMMSQDDLDARRQHAVRHIRPRGRAPRR